MFVKIVQEKSTENKNIVRVNPRFILTSAGYAIKTLYIISVYVKFKYSAWLT